MASAAGGIERYGAASVEGKEELFSTWYTRAHGYARARSMGYAEMHVQGYPPRSRSRRPCAGQSPSVIERFSGARYIRTYEE